MIVGDAGQTILAPAIGARTGLVVAKIVPGVTPLAVILAHGSPLAFAQVGSPLFPGGFVGARFLEPDLFSRHGPFFLSQISAAFDMRAAGSLVRQTEHVLVVPGHGLELGLLG